MNLITIDLDTLKASLLEMAEDPNVDIDLPSIKADVIESIYPSLQRTLELVQVRVPATEEPSQEMVTQELIRTVIKEYRQFSRRDAEEAMEVFTEILEECNPPSIDNFNALTKEVFDGSNKERKISSRHYPLDVYVRLANKITREFYRPNGGRTPAFEEEKKITMDLRDWQSLTNSIRMALEDADRYGEYIELYLTNDNRITGGKIILRRNIDIGFTSGECPPRNQRRGR